MTNYLIGFCIGVVIVNALSALGLALRLYKVCRTAGVSKIRSVGVAVWTIVAGVFFII